MINNKINNDLETSFLIYIGRKEGIFSKLGELTDIYKYVVDLILFSTFYKQYRQPKLSLKWLIIYQM